MHESYRMHGASYDQSFYETRTVSHEWPFTLHNKSLPWMSLKGQIKDIVSF